MSKIYSQVANRSTNIRDLADRLYAHPDIVVYYDLESVMWHRSVNSNANAENSLYDYLSKETNMERAFNLLCYIGYSLLPIDYESVMLKLVEARCHKAVNLLAMLGIKPPTTALFYDGSSAEAWAATVLFNKRIFEYVRQNRKAEFVRDMQPCLVYGQMAHMLGFQKAEMDIEQYSRKCFATNNLRAFEYVLLSNHPDFINPVNGKEVPLSTETMKMLIETDNVRMLELMIRYGFAADTPIEGVPAYVYAFRRPAFADPENYKIFFDGAGRLYKEKHERDVTTEATNLFASYDAAEASKRTKAMVDLLKPGTNEKIINHYETLGGRKNDPPLNGGVDISANLGERAITTYRVESYQDKKRLGQAFKSPNSEYVPRSNKHKIACKPGHWILQVSNDENDSFYIELDLKVLNYTNLLKKMIDGAYNEAELEKEEIDFTQVTKDFKDKNKLYASLVTIFTYIHGLVNNNLNMDPNSDESPPAWIAELFSGYKAIDLLNLLPLIDYLDAPELRSTVLYFLNIEMKGLSVQEIRYLYTNINSLVFELNFGPTNGLGKYDPNYLNYEQVFNYPRFIWLCA